MKTIYFVYFFLYIFSFSILADTSNFPLPKEEIGNRKLSYAEVGTYGQEKQRLKYKYTVEIGLPDSFYKLSVISLGYNINGLFSVGISRNFSRQNYYDFSYYDGTRTLSKGVYTEAGSVPAQDYGATFPLPQMGTNLFLHFYPLIKENIPIYIPLYLGRTDSSVLINQSENAVFNPIYQNEKPNRPIPILHMSADAPATFYSGYGLGVKLVLPGGAIGGIEFGMVNLHNPQYNYNIQASILNKNPISLQEFFILQEQLKYAIQPIDRVKFNYGIMVGIAF